MGAATPIVTRAQVDEAWDVYVSLARELANKPSLTFCRPHMEEYVRAHERWRRLFILLDNMPAGDAS